MKKRVYCIVILSVLALTAILLLSLRTNQSLLVKSSIENLNSFYKLIRWDNHSSRFFVTIDKSDSKNYGLMRKIAIELFKKYGKEYKLNSLDWNISFFTDRKYANYKTELCESMPFFDYNEFLNSYVVEYYSKGNNGQFPENSFVEQKSRRIISGPDYFGTHNE